MYHKVFIRSLLNCVHTIPDSFYGGAKKLYWTAAGFILLCGNVRLPQIKIYSLLAHKICTAHQM